MKHIIFSLLMFQFAFSQGNEDDAIVAPIDSLHYYFNKGEYKKGLRHGQHLLKYFKQHQLTKEIKFVQIIQLLAVMAENCMDFKNEKIYNDLLLNHINVFEFNQEYLAKVYYVLATYYSEIKDIKKVEYCTNKAIKISENSKFENKVYYYTLDLHAKILMNQYEKFNDRIPEIQACFDKLLKITLLLFGVNSTEYLEILKDKSVFDFKQRNYQNARASSLKCLSLLDTVNDTNIEINIEILNNLARISLDTDDFSKVKDFNQRGIDLTLKKYGENHKYHLDFLSNESALEYRLGRYVNAKLLTKKCLRIVAKTYGRKSVYYSSIIGDYASMLNKNDIDFKDKEKLYKEALILKNRLLGQNNIKTIQAQSQLARFYSSIGKFSEAVSLNRTAIQNIKNKSEKNKLTYAILISDLAENYRDLKNLANAKKYRIESYNIFKKINNYTSDIITRKLHDNVYFFNDLGDNINTVKFLLEYLKLVNYKIVYNNIRYSQQDLSTYSERLLPSNSFNSFLQTNPTQFPDLNIGCYENELLLKNLSLRNQQRIKNSIEKSNDADLKEKYKQFITNKRYLNKLDELPIAQKPSEYDSIKNHTEKLEKDITRLSTEFADAKKTLSVTWKQIQEKLKPNEVVIDMVSYNYYNKKWTDSIVYGAFIIKKDSKFPKYITLFEQNQLQNLLKKESDTIDVSRINEQYQSKAIADLLLKPLEQDLKGINTVYLSPSGLGHQINFLALPVSSSQTFGDTFQIHILGSTSEILSYKTASLDKKINLELLLYGNIDYDKSEATNKIIADTISANNIEFVSLTTRSTNTDKLKYLAGSKIEINKINALATLNNFKSAIIDDKNATEESIKALDGNTKPYVLHLATHGFFFPDAKIEIPQKLTSEESPKKNFYKSADDPMMRSGLLFAGANKFWGKPNENITTDDGILTASEISNLNLSACQLVVMSACETGLGDINGSEGVFGLQRAFKMAGVKNIIMSLWKIDDEKTVEFFDVFYANCFKGISIHDAFQVAQTEMKVKYKPFYWAGFVLLE